MRPFFVQFRAQHKSFPLFSRALNMAVLKETDCDIVVIGGGLGGCLVSMQLLQQHPGAKVCIIEKKAEHLARGVAYARHFTEQLLNVPVIGMSIDPDQPEHFYNWLTTHVNKYPQLKFDAHTFVPRSIYGDYVEETFNRVAQQAGNRLNIVFDEAIQVEKKQEGITVWCKHQLQIHARYLVLATGNLPPADISIKNTSFLQSPLYVSNPWTPGLIRDLDTHKNVLLVGSGLTAIDIVLALYDQHHFGNVYLLSRRGKLPLPHSPVKPHQFSQPEGLLSGNVKTITDTLRKEVKDFAAQGITWQQVMDAIRPWTQKAWKKLDMEQKKIFLSRLRSYWEIHRHRVPAASLDKINQMKAKGQLVHYAGNITDVLEMHNEKAEVLYTHKNKIYSITADLVINCTGPENNFRKHNMPLLVDMMKKGYAVSDELNLGIACDESGRLMNTDHQADPVFYCMGHLRKGTLWETTAARELREQAREMARNIVL